MNVFSPDCVVDTESNIIVILHEICAHFSCFTVGELFCRTVQQMKNVIAILSQVKLNDDVSLGELKNDLSDVSSRCVSMHLQRFVFLFFYVVSKPWQD